MYALIQDNQITHVGPLPLIWWDGHRPGLTRATTQPSPSPGGLG